MSKIHVFVKKMARKGPKIHKNALRNIGPWKL